MLDLSEPENHRKLSRLMACSERYLDTVHLSVISKLNCESQLALWTDLYSFNFYQQPTHRIKIHGFGIAISSHADNLIGIERSYLLCALKRKRREDFG